MSGRNHVFHNRLICENIDINFILNEPMLKKELRSVFGIAVRFAFRTMLVCLVAFFWWQMAGCGGARPWALTYRGYGEQPAVRRKSGPIEIVAENSTRAVRIVGEYTYPQADANLATPKDSIIDLMMSDGRRRGIDCLTNLRFSVFGADYDGSASACVFVNESNHALPGVARSSPVIDSQLRRGKAPKLAVMEIEDTTRLLSRKDSHAATDYIRSSLSQTQAFIIIDKSRQQQALKQMVIAQKVDSYKECYDATCQIPLGQAIAADTIFRTTISKIGDECILAIELIDLEKEASVAGLVERFNCTTKGLLSAIDSTVSRIN